MVQMNGIFHSESSGREPKSGNSSIFFCSEMSKNGNSIYFYHFSKKQVNSLKNTFQ